MAFGFNDLADCRSNGFAVVGTEVSVVVFINNMNDELRALGILAESDCIYFEQVNLPVDLYMVDNEENVNFILFLVMLNRCWFVIMICLSCLNPYLLYFVIIHDR